jgi:uncharacterized protein (DUF1697 family)
MPQYIAFLRGINVGGHRLKMDQLRVIFTELGLMDVSTFIASGNVSFSTDSDDADGLREMVEGHLASQLGYEVPTFIRTPAELAAIVSFNPPETVTRTPSLSSHYVIFLDTRAPHSLRSALTRLNSEVDQFHFSDTEVHWLIKGKLTESPLFGRPELDRATRGVRTTIRNMNTLRRIASKTDRAEA